jgi:hypothetical protein
LKGTPSPVAPGNTGGVGNGGEGFSIIPDGYGGYTDTAGNPVDEYGMPIAAAPRETYSSNTTTTNIDDTQDQTG